MCKLQNGILVAGIVGLATVATAATAASAAPTTKPLHIMKECSAYVDTPPTYCTITDSNVPALPKGTKIWYWGPDMGMETDPLMVASSATIDAGKDNLATGFCIVDQTDMANQKGTCAFSAGTGTLSGFKAVISVSVDAHGGIHWDGSYWSAGK